MRAVAIVGAVATFDGMLDEVTDLILGPRRYTRAETSDLSGMPMDEATALWRAMGFPVVGDDERAFTDRDVAALRTAAALRAGDVVDGDGLLALTRSMAQSLSRLAVSHAAIAADFLARAGDQADAAAHEAADELVPAVASLLDFVWRRHLAAAAESAFVEAVEAPGGPPVAVGFADLVGFTELSRTLPRDALAEAVERFEAVTAHVVGDRAGRVVKTLGDEVMFAVGDVAVAADVALALVDAVATELGQAVRVGVAFGPVLARLGDVYGPTVNIASRLTGLAHPGTALVDREAAAALRADPSYDLAPIRRQAVRGYGHLAPFRLRRQG
jgi:adenylate cyclase